MGTWDELFRPLEVGSITLANRLFTTAHATQLVADDPSGHHGWSVLGRRALAYYEERARGGFALQVIGQTQVHPQSGTDRPSSYGPTVVDRYHDIAEACHRHGSAVFVQLNHNGIERGSTGPDAWEPMWTASSRPAGHGEMTRSMSEAEIADLVGAFAEAAVRCREAGVDGVEIHAAHPHMLGEWLTEAFNRRQDRYGGSLENRLRIVVEIIDAVRSAVGPSFVLGVRTNGAWMAPGGHTVEEGAEIATALAATGQIDFLDVSGVPTIGGIGTPFGALVPWAASVKAAVPDLPVFTVGRIVRPEQAAEVLASGAADMVGMTRASIAGPDLPRKAREGRDGEIHVCIGAGQGCLMRNRERRPLTCQQNAAAGREELWGGGTLVAAPGRRRVVVVGGGPAGLEAAVVAARRGHEVTLLERGDRLGGQVRLIERNPRRAEFAEIVDVRAREADLLDVDVRLGAGATVESIVALEPDRVVLATGSRPRRDGWYTPRPHEQALPGHDLGHVVTTWDVLDGACDGAAHVAVVDAHGYHHTLDAVEHLARRGVRTTLIGHSPVLVPGIDDHDRPDAMAVLRSGPVTLQPMTLVESIGLDHLTLRSTFRGGSTVLPDVDAVVLSIGQDPVDDLSSGLTGAGLEVDVIGDCRAPRGVEHAVFEGHRAGRAV